MGKKKRGHPDVEEILARPWCYYCERDFEDLKLLISHQKAKHFKCDRCGRRLNTAGGLSVHLNQVHKENLDQVENALPNRTGLEVEIFGMEGIPQEVLEQHRNRIVQTFYQAQEDRRVATGNPLPGQTLQNSRKPIKYETEEELLRRLAQYRTQKNDVVAPNEGAMDGVVHHHATQYPGHADQQLAHPPYGYSGDSLPPRPASIATAPHGLPQRPTQSGYGQPPGDDIDNLIRMAEAGIKPSQKADDHDNANENPGKKEKKIRMTYDDEYMSPEERMGALPRYAFSAVSAA